MLHIITSNVGYQLPSMWMLHITINIYYHQYLKVIFQLIACPQRYAVFAVMEILQRQRFTELLFLLLLKNVGSATLRESDILSVRRP